jgi:hypothetical protein
MLSGTLPISTDLEQLIFFILLSLKLLQAFIKVFLDRLGTQHFEASHDLNIGSENFFDVTLICLVLLHRHLLLPLGI